MSNGRSDPSPAHALHPVLAPVVVILGVAGMFAASGLASRIGLRPGLALAEMALLAPAILLLAVSGLPLRSALALERPQARTVWLAVAAGASLWVASLGLFELQYSVWRPPPGYLEAFRGLHEALRPKGPLDAVVSVATIAVIPATCEELLFRGVVLPALLRALGAAAASLVAAALFGLIHVDLTAGSPSLYRVPFAFMVGLALGVLRLRTGSLPPAILAHATLNTITFLAVPYADDPGQGLPDPRPWLGGVFFAMGSAASSFVILRMRPALIATDRTHRLP